jgi:hypothetical protein
MRSHPQLFFSRPKEPTYWATDYPKVREIRGFDTRAKYEALFASAEAQQAVIRAEGSTIYLYSREAVPNIVREVPGARFIVALRNPVDLVVSFHRTQQLLLNEDQPDFALAWRRNLEGGLPGSALLDPKLVDYARVGRLGQAVSNLLDVVARDRVHFVRFETLVTDPLSVWRSLTSFIGLPEEPVPTWEVKNPSTRMFRSNTLHSLINRPPPLLADPMRRLRLASLRSKNPLIRGLKRQLWWREAPKPRTTASTRAELSQYFESDVKLLGEVLDQDFSSWTRV